MRVARNQPAAPPDDERLREAQRVFSATGGLHAAGLSAVDGEPLALREDVGKCRRQVGRLGAACGRLPLAGCVPLDSCAAAP
jgi:FdhD protein